LSNRRRPSSLAFGIALSLVYLAVPGLGVSKPTAEPPKPAAGAPAAESGSKLSWLEFDAATDLAAKQKKHLIVDIYTTWCGWCKVMDRQTYGDPQVSSYLIDNFVLAKVNGESSAKMHWKGRELTERQFAREVGVTGYPATYFMKPDAELLGGVAGYIKSPDFMMYARYVSTKWYEKGNVQQYADSLRAAAQ
jgi:thioredoxin-related protein